MRVSQRALRYQDCIEKKHITYHPSLSLISSWSVSYDSSLAITELSRILQCGGSLDHCLAACFILFTMPVMSILSSSSSFTLPFSADLVSLCQAHTAFLLALHQRGVSLATPTQASLTRYVDFWLPLVASVAVGNGNSLLVPPSDIAWLWHCHRLSPARYRAYCQKSFDGTVLEAQPPFSFQHRENNMDISFATPDTETMTASHTRDLWETA